jgi:hypothetical protein
MKNYQKGFGVVGALLIVVIIGLIGVVGWLTWDKQHNSADKGTGMGANQNSANKSTVATSSNKIDTSVHEVDIKMQTASDINKLPEYTPASFKTYMLDKLQSNKYTYNTIDDVDTITEFQIDKISQVNIRGGQVPVDKNGEGHAGGAPAIWALTPKGTWDQETLNGPMCKSKNGGLIYEEFVKECYTDSNTSALVKNPNGSISSINK